MTAKSSLSLEQAAGALCALAEDSTKWITAVEISRHLRESEGIDLHWRTIDKQMADNKGLATRRKRLGRWEYKPLFAAKALGRIPDESVIFVDPSSALQATRKLHEILAKLKGHVRLCDPYLDEFTIEHVEACGPGKPIKILTMKVNETGALRRVVAAAKTAGFQLEIRVVVAKVLHDRYAIDDSSLLILGASLNGFGKKQSFVIQAGKDIRGTVLSAFDQQWATATPWSP